MMLSCNTTPKGVVLPYTDNYQALASLKHYKDWGTYNVHDLACIKTRKITKKQLTGKWEIIQLKESTYKRGTYAGQILWGENRFRSQWV
ncbi:MAG: hypothetical protein PHF38_06795 [Bacteroidales bacterium]|nr:hypothetical protein [Bacteroidales bacterium]